MTFYFKLLSRYLTCFMITAVTMLCFICLFPVSSNAKTTRPKWKKELASIEIGKSFRYRIKHCPKKAKVQFSSSHTSRATIHRKTGLFRAKKSGSVIITAKIQQNGIKTKRLKTKIRIVKKSKSAKKNITTDLSKKVVKKNSPSTSGILSHVTFTVAESIHPWNHSIILYSNRILLLSEVQNTSLSLMHQPTNANTKKDLTLTAHFHSLSSDGKSVTYRLNEESARKMCPGNGILDGEYLITSNIFQETLRTKYQERICYHSVNGFVLDSQQKSLPQVSVKLYSDYGNILLAETTTDKNGYYQFQNITKNNVTLTAELKGYDPYSLSSLKPSGQNICQNIILHPSSTKNLAVSCQILDEQNKPITDTAVVLTTESNISAHRDFLNTEEKPGRLFLKGFVDSKGTILFANQKSIHGKGYTRIKHYHDQSTPEYFDKKMPISDSIISDPCHSFNRQENYVLTIFPKTNGSSMPKDYEMISFSFSFAPLLSDHLLVQVHLRELPSISAEKLSIQADGLEVPHTNYHYTLYDKNGYALFQTDLSPLSEDHRQDYAKQLTLALQDQKIRLQSGNYFAAIIASSSTDPVFSAIVVQPVQIQNQRLSATHFQLSACRTFHALVLADGNSEQVEPISFNLFQKMDTTWIPVGTYTTSSFTDIYSKQKAYLKIPVSISNAVYLLMPTNHKYQISSGAVLTVSSSQSIITSVPEHQIQIINHSKDTEIPIAQQITSELLQFSTPTANMISLHHAYYASSVTYPNTIYAYYQPNGELTSLFFTTPGLSSNHNTTSTLICDRLQNGISISTTQTAYSSTPFFVT